ncbi:hypothetical protein M2132_000092 [Dysgonomonas sp. PH5-45]|uniref:DUF4834 family protein n=1 Tax=unclassified Dysgonomonas TaxID=2630389 RepID=UPI002473D133|nr:MULTISPECIES: DUF4834 family protein [unclassified Dysgonomonas]MDH6353775.1 hypothetical protein [Dysgonomonas sp. PH5-45]MDH6386678.1 hypothetical protein [Dysgonomonas sp. PH5-37]
MSFIVFILFLILAFFVAILAAGGQIISAILRFLFGKPNTGNQSKQNSKQRYNSNTSHNDTADSHSQKKIFRKDEGEYVDYEDVNDSSQ